MSRNRFGFSARPPASYLPHPCPTEISAAMSDEVVALVVDNGSGMCKVGVADFGITWVELLRSE